MNNKLFKTDKEIEIFLNELIAEVRKLVNDDKMINKCDMCQGLIGRCLDRLGILYYPCSTNKVISENVTGHSFIVANIQGKVFLIDPAFIQFKYNIGKEVVIKGMRCVSKSPYYYLNIIDSELTKRLTTIGYTELNKKSAYAYGNAFYFTKTNISSNMKLTPIDGEIFMNSFKKGNDKLRDYGVGHISIKK